MLIARSVLVAGGSFGADLPASQVTGAIGRGLEAGGSPAPDLFPIEFGREEFVPALATLDFDARMRAARALVIADRCLEEQTLRESPSFEIATRARQAGVPCYAVTAENHLGAFDARVLDMQLILRASDTRALAAAGRRLAGLI
jgi:glycerate kinase